MAPRGPAEDSFVRPSRVCVIVGPTAVGKSEVAAFAAEQLNGEVVSTDSMQIYKFMDIGTAKPSPEILTLVPHHLIDIIDPDVDFSVARYQQLARQAVAGIAARGRLPIVAGGSGLYVRSIIDPLDFPTAKPGSALRIELEQLAENDPDELINRLKAVDPAACERLDLRNLRRVVRAIEAAAGNGDSHHLRVERWRRREPLFDIVMVGLAVPRPVLNKIIEARVDGMIAGGLVTEVQDLMKARPISVTARQALGYKEIIGFLDGEMGLDEAVELIKRRTRQLAKRQMTWFKADPRVVWIDGALLNKQIVAKQIVELVKESGFVVT